MYAGIDFGTSNCSIGVWEADKPILLPLEGDDPRLPSAMYASRFDLDVEPIDFFELNRRIGLAISRQAAQIKRGEEHGRKVRELSRDELENIERGIMRRELAERARRKYEGQTLSDALYSDSEIVFGEEAILRHIESPQSGYFIKSPKSFIGADIESHHVDRFSEIITRMLAYIKTRAEQRQSASIDSVVLGRPVTFHGQRGEAGNKQALRILERSAIAAGFKYVEFLMEPIAAAFDFERGLLRDRVV